MPCCPTRIDLGPYNHCHIGDKLAPINEMYCLLTLKKKTGYETQMFVIEVFLDIRLVRFGSCLKMKWYAQV
jgi:hypothetical protein